MSSPSGASQSQIGDTIRRCCPSNVVWMPVMVNSGTQYVFLRSHLPGNTYCVPEFSWGPLKAGAAQGEAEQAEQCGRQEEARVPLVVPGRAGGLVDLALLQRVEHRAQAVFQRLLVGRCVVRAAGDARDLLEQVGIDVDLDRLVRGAPEQIGSGRVGHTAALADQDRVHLDAQILSDLSSLQRRDVAGVVV